MMSEYSKNHSTTIQSGHSSGQNIYIYIYIYIRIYITI